MGLAMLHFSRSAMLTGCSLDRAPTHAELYQEAESGRSALRELGPPNPPGPQPPAAAGEWGEIARDGRRRTLVGCVNRDQEWCFALAPDHYASGE